MLNNIITLNELGFSKDNIKDIDNIILKKSGAVIVSGVLGSAKHLTLKSLIELKLKNEKNINELNLYNIIMNNDIKKIEDEYNIVFLPQILDKINFKKLLNLIEEKQNIFTSIYSENLFNTIENLGKFKLENKRMIDYNSISGIIYQIPIRQLCSHCSFPIDNQNHDIIDILKSKYNINELKNVRIKGFGCNHCNNSGYAQYTICSEILNPDPYILELINNNLEEAKNYWKKELNGKTAFEIAIEKMQIGLIDPLEIIDIFNINKKGL